MLTLAEVWQRMRSHLAGAAPAGPRGTPAVRFLLAGAACLLMAGFAAQAICHAGDIFQEWDSVVSWNRWAIDWAANHLPRSTAEYPQLLPCNLSLSYVFIQDSSIWFFAKGWLFLFCLFVLLAMFDLGRQTGQAGYFLGVLLTYALLIGVLRFRYISSGYADMPVASMAYAGVYALLVARGAAGAGPANEIRRARRAALRGAALTKQAGLLVAAVYPLLAWLLVYRPATITSPPADTSPSASEGQKSRGPRQCFPRFRFGLVSQISCGGTRLSAWRLAGAGDHHRALVRLQAHCHPPSRRPRA